LEKIRNYAILKIISS